MNKQELYLSPIQREKGLALDYCFYNIVISITAQNLGVMVINEWNSFVFHILGKFGLRYFGNPIVYDPLSYS